MTGGTRFPPYVFWSASLGAAIVLGLAFFLVSDDGPIVCVFRLTAGLPCPGCGLTRSVGHLLHGGLARSVALHPFGPILAAEAAVLWTVAGFRVYRGLPIGVPDGVERWAVGHVVVLIALWLGRLATGTAPF